MAVFVELPPPGENASVKWQEALQNALRTGDNKICFHPGRYDFYPGGCTKKFLHFSNNDKGEKTIALHLNGLKDFTIEGSGTELFFHGRISPIIAENCENLHIRNLSIDFEDSFVSGAEVKEFSDNTSWMAFSGTQRFSDGKIIFCGDRFDNLSGELHIRPFNPDSGEMPWDTDVTVVKNKDLKEKDGLFGLPGKMPAKHVLIKHEDRLCPGIVLSFCSEVRVVNCTIYHAAGMGLLAQFCSNVTYDGISIIPRNRYVSASDDAMHMVECRGKLLVVNCTCAGTLDDSLNVHGIYRPTAAAEGENRLYLDTGHFQQAGFPGALPGDTLEFVKSATGRAYALGKVLSVGQLDENRTCVELEQALPADWTPGDCVRVLEPGEAVLEVANCHFTTLRGRGVLASGLSSCSIKNCCFHTSGAAVFIAGGCTAWYETGPVRQACIENNVFENCCYQRWSSTRETVSVYPDISQYPPDFYYHGKIEIRNNRFISQKRPQIAVLSTEEVCISGNDFKYNNDYPFDPPERKVYTFAEKDSPCTIFKQVKSVNCDNNNGIY